MKTDYQKLNTPLLFRTLRTDELTHWEIQQILVGRSIEDIKKLREDGDPLLHEACTFGLSYIGARRLLSVCFEDPTLRTLFVDPSYTDRFGWRPIDWLVRQNGSRTRSSSWFIIDDILREFGSQSRFK